MSKSSELEARLNDVLLQVAELRAENRELRAQITQLRPPQPNPEPRWRTLPGQIGEFGVDGMPRVPNGSSAVVDPAQCTVGASGGFGGPPRAVTLPNGVSGFRFPDGLVRNGQGEIITVAGSSVSTGEGPVRSSMHQQAIDAVDKAFPVVRMTLDQD